MPTLSDLVDEAVSALSGFTTDLPMRGTLLNNISTGDTSLTLSFPVSEQHPLGLVEIGTEVLLVESYDVSTGVATVPPWGRGQLGTTAQPHDSGSMVTVSPRFPRGVVAKRVNEAVQSICPPLFGVAEVPEFRVGFREYLFALPASTQRVLRLEYRFANVGDWAPLRFFDFRAASNELWLPGRYAGAHVRGQVAVAPGQFLAESDDYETVTGLDAGTTDIVHNAVVARLVMAGDLARQATGTVESSARNREINSGAGAAIARFHLALNEQRLAAEAARLSQMYPPLVIRKG
jgi:hypothetical protein